AAGKDMWWCSGHKVDDDYIQNAAHLIKDRLNPHLKCWFEYSNENQWNNAFPQRKYTADVLMPRYGVRNTARAYGRRAAECNKIMKEVMGDRVIRIMSGQATYSFQLQEALAEATIDSELQVDVGTVSSYFYLQPIDDF